MKKITILLIGVLCGGVAITQQITVHSQTGALVFQQKQVTAAQTLQLSSLLPGYYVVRIVVGEKMVIKGIIKQ